MKELKAPFVQTELPYRQDINADGFRDLCQNYRAPIYDYALNYLNNEVAALNMTNDYFVDLAERFTNFEQKEGLMDKVSPDTQ